MHSDTVITTDGVVRHTIELEDCPHEVDYETVVIESPRDSEQLDTYCYSDGKVGFSQQFQQRSLSFHPISLHGGGSHEARLTGCIPVKSNPYEGKDTDMIQIPYDLTVSFAHLGLTPVPNGEWWL